MTELPTDAIRECLQPSMMNIATTNQARAQFNALLDALTKANAVIELREDYSGTCPACGQMGDASDDRENFREALAAKDARIAELEKQIAGDFS